MNNIENRALREAYALLEKAAPLGRGDCGRLCRSACCGGENSDGMLLFPFEDELFEGKDGFEIIERADGAKLLVCSGKCERRQRPLSCRLFPLFPLVYEENEKNELKVIRDPRFGVCPLNRFDMSLNPQFVRSVRLAGRYLMRDDSQRDFLQKISEELLEILSFRERMGII